MKQFSTGTGLVALSIGIVATAFIATHRGGSEAFAQVTGGDRRIVSASVMADKNNNLIAYRLWSDNVIDLRNLGTFTDVSVNCRWSNGSGNLYVPGFVRPSIRLPDGYTCDGVDPSVLGWITADNGTSGFRPLTDVDMSGETDAGDIAQVLMDFNTRSDDLPPPPIDCTINAPR